MLFFNRLEFYLVELFDCCRCDTASSALYYATSDVTRTSGLGDINLFEGRHVSSTYYRRLANHEQRKQIVATIQFL